MPLLCKCASLYNDVIPSRRGGGKDAETSCTHLLAHDIVDSRNDARHGKADENDTDRSARGGDNISEETFSTMGHA